MKNNLIFICLLALILLGVGCVSATPELGSDDTLKISNSNENVTADIDDACLGQSISSDGNYGYNDVNGDILGDNSEGTFTDLQEKINAAGGVLDLEYNFTFNSNFDDFDDFECGVKINKPLTVNGNGYTISGNNTVSIMNIKGNGVILNNVTFVDGYFKGKSGGAIYSVGNLIINNCTFTNCLDSEGYAIDNDNGNLSLSNNTVGGNIYNNGIITSETTAVVLENSTHNIFSDTFNLTAALVDDNGNVIFDNDLMLFVNGEEFNFTFFRNGIYIYEDYHIAFGQTYIVSAASVREEQLTVKTGIVRNINGTYTDLKSRVDATAPGGVLVLPYNFIYDADVDGNSLSHGIYIKKDLVINGNGKMINGSRSAIGLVIIECNVVLNKIVFADEKFEDRGGAIYSIGNLTIKDCTFINSIDEFGRVIYSDGDLSLSGNTVQGIIYNHGVITSATTAVVLDNKTHVANTDTYDLTATLVDDNGNKIQDLGFEFVVNGNKVGFPYYNRGVYLYRNYTISPGQTYLVGASSYNERQLKVKTAVIKTKKGSFTDLQGKINAATGVLDLEYNFTYDKYFDDHDHLEWGVVINKKLVVNGNGYTISGKNIASIIQIYNRGVATLNNITFVDGFYGGIGGGGVLSYGNLTINNCTFTNCRDQYDSAIDNDGGTLSLSGNSIDSIIYNKGKITSETTAVVLENSTHNIFSDTFNLTAALVDDNGNVIFDNDLMLFVNGEEFNFTFFRNGIYIYEDYHIAFGQTYIVSAASVREEQLTVKTGIVRNINGTYTDLKSRVDATAPGGVLVLPYNFIYDADVDGNSLSHGIYIKKDLVINGNGKMINGSRSAIGLVIIECNVVLNKIVFADEKFEDRGGAIYSIGNLTIKDCTFINSIDEFGRVIYSDGDLSLSGNTVQGIIYNHGVITSATTAVVLDNKTHVANTDTYDLTATLVDDNGNKIQDLGFEFVVNGNKVGFPYYNRGVYLYRNYTISPGQTYLVGASSYNERQLTVKTAVINNLKGTFLDLQSQISNAIAAGESSLNLSYDFIYNNEFDGDYISRIAIYGDLIINGNGFNISGNNSAPIFDIVGCEVVLNNITFVDGNSSDDGGAVHSNGNLTINDCNFINCRDKNLFAIYNDHGNLSLSGNTVNGIIFNGGMITSPTTAVVLENDTYTTANDTYDLNAILVDDSGNIIQDTSFLFVVNGDEIKYTSYIGGVYGFEDYAINPLHIYTVGAVAANENQLTVKTGVIRNIKGTFADLQSKVKDAEDVLDLSYNFTFNKDFDDDSLRQGVFIAKDIVINGNAYTISGNNSASILVIDSSNVILNNISFVDGVFDKKGGAIYAFGNLTINGCTFTNCRDDYGYAIYNEDTLSLKGNVVEGTIYNRGVITSPVTVVFLNGETKTFDAFVDAVVYAKLTDDNGNIIVNMENLIRLSTNAFTNDDVSIFILNKTDNLYYATVTPVKTGLGASSSSSLDDAYPDNTVVSLIMFVNPTNRTLVVTFDDNITAVDSLGVAVNVTRTIDGKPVVATVNVTIGNVTKSVTTGENGLATITFDPFKVNEYVVNASIAADESYTYTEELYDLTVNKADSSVVIDPVGAVTYPEDVAVSFNVTNPTSVTYVVKTKDGKVIIENTTIADVGADLVLSGLDAGEYTVVIANAGNENVNGVVDSADFTVECADSSVTVDPVSVVYGEDIVLPVLCENATGIDYAIIHDGTVVVNGTLAPGMNISVSDLPAGEYTVKVTTVTDGNHNPDSDEASLSIDKASPIIDVQVVDIIYGDVEMLNITVSAPGTVKVTVNGVTKILVLNADSSAKLHYAEYKANWNISDLPVGQYPVFVQYNGNENYTSVNTSDVFNVKPIMPSMDVKADSIIEGDDLIVEVSLPDDAKGNVAANVNGKTYTAPIKDGKATIVIPNLTAGNYTVPVTYSGDDKYDSVKKDVNVTVDGDKPNIVSAPDVTKYFHGPERFVVTVTDYQGNALVNKSVTIVINGISYSRITNTNGTASIALGLNSGVYNATVIVDDQSVNSVITILTTVNGTDIIKVFRNATQYYATFLDSQGNYLKDGETVRFNINGVMYDRKVSGDKGLARLNINLLAGKYIVTAMNLVTGESTANNITVVKMESEIMMYAYNITDSDVDGKIADIILPGDAMGNVSVTVGNDTTIYDILSSDHTSRGGKTVMFIHSNGLKAGEYNISATYEGNEYYNPSSANDRFVVSKSPKKDLNVSVSADPITAGEDAVIVVSGLADATGNVSASVNGKTYTSPIDVGKATIVVPGLTENTTAIVTYSGDDKYNSFAKKVNVTVDEDKSDIIKAPDVTKYFHGPERFVVTVTDYQGNALVNKSVTIVINGVSYARKTDVNGTASIALGLNSGVYDATVTVDNRTVNSVVTILATVNGTDIVKMYRNGTQYYATFLDSQGNYLKDGETVRFNIYGVMYDRKVSGDKGLARLNINLEQGEYVITAINLVTGDKAANNITVLPLFTENRDITKYYKNGTQYTVKVLGDDGNPVGAGENVTFNINGVFYTRQSDANGIAKLNINLQPGDYIITAQYKGCMVSNNIKVLPILNAADITMKYRDGTKFEAKLVDGQGKPFAGQTLTFNINGVMYNRITDGSGIARLNINLMPGEYIITSMYSNGATIANKGTVRS